MTPFMLAGFVICVMSNPPVCAEFRASKLMTFDTLEACHAAAREKASIAVLTMGPPGMEWKAVTRCLGPHEEES